MRTTGEWMKRHLSVEVRTPDGVQTTPVEDPFHRTTVMHTVEFSLWDRVKLLFHGKYTVEFQAAVHASDVAVRRWFFGQDSCTDCEIANRGVPKAGHYICPQCVAARLNGQIRTPAQRKLESQLQHVCAVDIANCAAVVPDKVEHGG